MKLVAAIFSVLMVVVSSVNAEEDLAQHLQDVSVTIKAPQKSGEGAGQGSGVIITREVKPKKDSTEKVKVNFVWTAAHVVDSLKETRTVIDPKTGTPRTVVEFRDAQIVQELKDGGRRVGEIKMDAKVIRFSDADSGEDLALLMVRKRNFVDVNTNFYLGDEIPPLGTQIFHVGSLLGQIGANSMTSGIVSQHGRVLQLGNGDGTVFDQTTATSFPGSSGGGVFLSGQHASPEWASKKGQYAGMLVRGAGEGFNLIVPMRRMKEWSKKVEIEWAINPAVEVPSIEELTDTRVEDIGLSFKAEKQSATPATPPQESPVTTEFHFWNIVPRLPNVSK